jgi:protein-disulfide isomerase
MRLTRSLIVTVTAVLTVLACAGAASSQKFITQQAAALTLDMKQVDACPKGTKFDSAINRDMTEGAGFSVNGTPTSFVGKTTNQGFEGSKDC